MRGELTELHRLWLYLEHDGQRRIAQVQDVRLNCFEL
jgi:hypothetical protein